jgi:hypothetical protein
MNNNQSMTPQEFSAFLTVFDLSDKDAADIFEVTIPAVKYWLTGQRRIQPLVAKLVRTLLRKPELLKEF